MTLTTTLGLSQTRDAAALAVLVSSWLRDEETANTTIWSSRVMRPDGKRDGDRGSRQRSDAAVPGFRKPCPMTACARAKVTSVRTKAA
jgi:hypothetical protein